MRHLRTVVEALIKAFGIFWLARGVAAVPHYLATQTIAAELGDDSLFRFTRNLVVVDGCISLIAAVALFAFASRIARLIVPMQDDSISEESRPFTQSDRDYLATVAMRTIAILLIAIGAIRSASLAAGWWLDSLSGHTEEVWYSRSRAASTFIQAVGSVAVGAILFPTSTRLGRFLAHVRGVRPNSP